MADRAVVIEVLGGAVNGTNTIFTTALPYGAGGLVVLINGQMKRQDLEDGWTETGPSTVTLTIAPKTGDQVQAIYRPA
jgi:hypothetical protein